MRDIKRFIIPVDFSETSKNAIKYASQLAHDFRSHGVECHLVHAVRSEELKSEAIQQLREFSTAVEGLPKVDFQFHAFSGLLEEVIKNIASGEGDLVIMGSKGDLGTGPSKSATFIHSFDAPVLMVPSSQHFSTPRKIALCIDNHIIEDSSALKPLNDLAKWFDASVHLIRVAQEQDSTENVNDDILNYYLETIAYNHQIIIDDDIEQGILSYVEENKIDLLAILPRTHAKSSQSSDGKLTNALAMHSDHPLLVLD